MRRRHEGGDNVQRPRLDLASPDITLEQEQPSRNQSGWARMVKAMDTISMQVSPCNEIHLRREMFSPSNSVSSTSSSLGSSRHSCLNSNFNVGRSS